MSWESSQLKYDSEEKSRLELTRSMMSRQIRREARLTGQVTWKYYPVELMEE